MRKGENYEREFVRKFGGKLVPASGALWWAKGDVRKVEYLIEIKGTEKPTIQVTEVMAEKIWLQAVKRFKMAILALRFPNGWRLFRVDKTLFDCGRRSMTVYHTASAFCVGEYEGSLMLELMSSWEGDE